MTSKRTIRDFFGGQSSTGTASNSGKLAAKRTKLDVEEVEFVKEVTKCEDNTFKEVVNLSDSQSSLRTNLKHFDSPEEALLQVFGYESFRTSLQEKAVKCVIAGDYDVFVSMPTGAGKSLCYQLPAVCDKSKVTIVVSPLIALITNQISALKEFSVSAESLNSHLSAQEQKRIRTELMSSRVKIKLLYITPEMAATEGFTLIVESLYKTNQLSRIAIDEAHCVSQWGHDFRPDYLKLGKLKRRYPNVVWVALTATASEKVVTDIISLLHLRSPVKRFICSNFRPNLFYDVFFRDTLKDPYDDLKEFVLNEIGPKDLPPPKSQKFSNANNFVEPSTKKNTDVGIIYCRTRNECENIATALSRFGIRANAYHAGMTKHQRNECQQKWMTGAIKCIIATVSFGMGVDKSNVRFVVHWNLPKSMTGYYQESGRAGRDGKPAKCRIYYSVEDRNAISYLIRQESEKRLGTSSSDATREEAKDALNRFEKMIKYCESGHKCRHSLLLCEFIGDDSVTKEGCKSSCDVCTKPKAVQTRLHEFQNIQLAKSLKTSAKIPDNLEDDWGLSKYDSPHIASTSEEREKEVSFNDIVRQEFKRRHKNASISHNPPDIKNMGFRNATDVMEPANQKIKDVNLTMRSQYVEKLKQEIAQHYSQVKQSNSSIDLNDSQITRIAAQFELSAYKEKNSKMTYRAVITQFVRNVKRATENSEFHESIVNCSQ